jgi:hypothetical protein
MRLSDKPLSRVSHQKNNLKRGCVKRFLPPAAAEYSFERHVIFTILLREIVKMTCLSKHNLPRSAVKNLFTQPRFNIKFCRQGRQIVSGAVFSNNFSKYPFF